METVVQRNVAFIGAGNMGSRMAARLLGHGYQVHVCEKDEGARAKLSDAGAHILNTPSDAGKFEVIIIMVASDQQLKDVVLEEHGILKGVDATQPPVLIVMSTVLPKTLTAVAETAGKSGVRVIDAPVSGGLVGAENGTLSVMVGGEEDVVSSVLPIIECVGNKIFRCGDLGAGETVKLLNNMIGVTSIYMVAEAFELATRSGLRLDVLANVLESSTGRTFLSENIETSCGQYARWAASEADFAALSRITLKDLQLANEFAGDAGLTLPTLSAVLQTLSRSAPGVFERWNALGDYRTTSR
jgi:3-hydroxyisobutyrate dehydrogenase-like beta-hydroxyacid dehydrogenase